MHLCNHGPDWSGLVELRLELERFLSARCRDPHEVDDAVQESLVRAARYRAQQRHPDRLLPWLLRIGANVLASRCQRQEHWSWRRSEGYDLEDVVDHTGPEDVLDDREVWCGGRVVALTRAATALGRALSRLSRRDRDTLGGLFYEGLRSKEVARRLGVPPELVKVRLFRAKQRLRKAFQRELEAAA